VDLSGHGKQAQAYPHFLLLTALPEPSHTEDNPKKIKDNVKTENNNKYKIL
jgi:hypothetical protein